MAPLQKREIISPFGNGLPGPITLIKGELGWIAGFPHFENGRGGGIANSPPFAKGGREGFKVFVWLRSVMTEKGGRYEARPSRML
ncbi:MAG: hypothetical protein JW882_11815 [Deltaproteobacteria bacterium]|nr:hypothetical protein [Deltaproteobacteria bacterium]